MSADEINVKYDVVIPDGATPAEEQAIREKAKQDAMDAVLRQLPGGSLFT